MQYTLIFLIYCRHDLSYLPLEMLLTLFLNILVFELTNGLLKLVETLSTAPRINLLLDV